MGFTSESDTASVYECNGHVNDLYFLDNNNNFLDVTFKKSIQVSNYETDKFIKSVDILKKIVWPDDLDEKKCFRLKKRITILEKNKGQAKGGTCPL